MPFSWKKKTRCTRFSQLVADHLQSPKHGGSLVVETGFPTSLIDLYVRNRGRFRRSNKRRGNDSSTPLSSSSPLDSSVNATNLSPVASDYRGSDEIIETDVVVDDMIGSVGEIESKIEEERAKSNRILEVALKVLFVMILALGTKRFTFGITVSAFVLFFLESVGKPLLGRLSLTRPGLDSKTTFESKFHGTKNIKSSEGNSSPVICNQALEIEEVMEVRSEKELDEVGGEVLNEIRDKSSRRAKMKSKMKQLVPKKLRTSKKSSMDLKGKISHGFKEEETVGTNQDLKRLVPSSTPSDSKGEALCISKQEPDKIVEMGRSSCQVDPNVELGTESQLNSGYLILCLIVLVGLVGGRILALLLALSWCLILKMTQWRNVKFSIS